MLNLYIKILFFMFQTDLILYVLKHTWFHKGHYKKKKKKRKIWVFCMMFWTFYSNLILKIIKKYKIVIQSNNNYKPYTSKSTIKGTSLDLSRMYYLMYCKSSGCFLATVNSDYCFHHLLLIFFYMNTPLSVKSIWN